MNHPTVVDGEALRIDAVRAMIRVLDDIGGAEPLARLLGETVHRVTHWREIPHRHVFAVEAATGIPHWDIRPDIDFALPQIASPWPPTDGDWVPEGVDVTDQIGHAKSLADPMIAQQVAFTELQVAFKKACDEPGMRNFRACAAAADEFERLVHL